MNRFISILIPFGIIVHILVLASSCKKEKSVFAVADFSYSGRTDTVPTTIQFINKSFGISYMWDFGDGSGSTDKNPRHTFNQPGTYNVKLIAKGTNNSDTMEVGIGIADFIPRNGLVGWWPFNGNANDESGNGNHGTVYGATLTTDRFGNQNGAYNFNGVNNWIQVQDHVSLRPNHITISAWIYTYISNENPVVTKTRIGNPFGPDGGEQYSLFQSPYSFQSTGGSFQIKRNGNCVNGGIGWVRITQADSMFNFGLWQLITATYDGIVMKLYKNNVLIGIHSPLPGGIDNCSGGTLNFGRYWDSNFFNGKLDDIGIWNRALTQQEITNLYNGRQ